jgi:hypothetical protein
MLTREKLQRGEGKLVAENPLIGLRKRASHNQKMASEEGLSQDEKEFRKTFLAMSEMVKVLYEDYLERKRPVLGESSKGKSEEEEDHPQIPPSPPSSPPSSPSSSSSSSKSCYPRYLGITRRSCLEAHMVLDMEYREQD